MPRVALAPRAKWGHADDCAFLATAYGLTPDPWQYTALEAFLGERKDGKWAATRCGLAVPRQNGKNGILEMLELYGLTVLGVKILHSAHEAKTARQAFIRLCAYFEDENFPELQALVKTIRRTNGQEGIVFTNGAEIQFIARTKGSGRGFTADWLILDEAQELSEEAMAAQRFAISSAPSRNPKIILTGTPPSPTMDGAYWKRMRATALERKDSRMAWLEWSLEGDVDLDDPENIAATNPSLGVRIELSTVLDERADMDDATFARERLGMWDSDKDLRAIPQEPWEDCKTENPPTSGAITWGMDASPDLSHVSIVAAVRGTKSTHVELTKVGSATDGTQWVVDWLKDPKRKKWEVVVDRWSPIAFIVDDLKKEGVKVHVTQTEEFTHGCSSFLSAVMERRVTHFDQHQLNRAVEGVSKRKVGDAQWAWNRKNHENNITPVVAASNAFHRAQSKPAASTHGPRRIY